jgi:uncharacterized integral membrane protein
VSVRFSVLPALAFGAAVAYLASLNVGRVRVAVAADWAWDVPLAALVVGAFLAGAVLALLLGLVRDLGRSYHEYQRAREARRAESLGASITAASTPSCRAAPRRPCRSTRSS